MEKKKRTSLIRTIYIVVTIFAIVLIGFLDPSIKDMAVVFKWLSLGWLYACIGSLLLYWLTDALLLYDITTYMYKREPFHRSLKVGIIGLYYGALTPFATGGQPMQVVYMHRGKIPVGTSTCIVCIKFVVYEISLCAFYVAAMLIRGPYFYTNHNQVFWLTTLGFVINLLAVLFIILTIRNKKLVLKIGGGLIRFLNRLKLVKKKEQVLENFEKTIDDYHTAAAYLSKYKLRAIGSFFISSVNLAFLFVIPYFIYLAFGHTAFGLLDIFTMQAFLYLAVSFFPTPGAAGAAEGGFYLFFSTFFINAPVYIAMLIWRFLTYYLILIVGSILVVSEELFAMRRLKKEVGAK
ncbi:MAG: lysylphosphatidylglycerol synthase transmembrane domain-containing protein [Eubacteriales bacterium]|nr:lysylphosphatidylglycerol synthase transmembrane domain-containing protein [Eubacteriales bacterium]